MLQDRLKKATKENHDELESLMFVNEIMNKTLTLAEYKTLLATNYIVHAAVEPKLHESLDEEVKTKLNIENRGKLAALEQDLAEMQISKADLEQLDLSFLSAEQYNSASSLGAMYVLEGATLGGHVIHKKLKANPAFENLNLRYYSVYDKDLMPNWLTFVNVLNTSVPEKDFALAEESAVKMFNSIATVSKTVKSSLS